MKTITPELIKELRERTGVGVGKCKAALEECGGDIEKAIENLRKAGIASAVKKESRVTNEGRIEYVEDSHGIAVVEMNAETDFVVGNERFKTLHKELARVLLEKQSKDVEHFLKEMTKSGKSIDEMRKELIAVLGENINISRILYQAKKENGSYGIYSHMQGKIFALVELSGAKGEDSFAREIAMHVTAESPDYLNEKEIPRDIVLKEEEIARSQVPANKPKEVLDKIVQGKLKAFYDSVCLLGQKFIKKPDVTIAVLVENRGKEIQKPLQIVKFIRWQTGS